MRACDAEREQAVDALREHYAAGRPSAEEFGARLDSAYLASTVQELEQPRRDLPDLPPSLDVRRAEVQRRQSELGVVTSHSGPGVYLLRFSSARSCGASAWELFSPVRAGRFDLHEYRRIAVVEEVRTHSPHACGRRCIAA
jgi:uncharacterized protein DUF1707